jgi:hypothetical protein
MARQLASAAVAPEGLESLDADFPVWEDEPTVSIPRWLMVLAARGEVTLRIAVDLETDPILDSDDTLSG